MYICIYTYNGNNSSNNDSNNDNRNDNNNNDKVVCLFAAPCGGEVLHFVVWMSRTRHPPM